MLQKIILDEGLLEKCIHCEFEGYIVGKTDINWLRSLLTSLIIYFFVGYISKFWRGFFPILIVELYNDNEIEETKPLSEEYGKLLEQLGHLFGDVHQIPIKESELKGIFFNDHQ